MRIVKRVIIDIERNNVLYVSDNGINTKEIDGTENLLNQDEISSVKTLLKTADKYGISSNSTVGTMKKTTISNGILSIISTTDKNYISAVNALPTTYVAIVIEFQNTIQQLLGDVPLVEIIYTKSTNILSINGQEMVAKNLRATPLLDKIETICNKLLAGN